MTTENAATPEIPSSAFVPCPLINFKNRSVSKCLGCEHFKGMIDIGNNAQFEERYRVACGHMIARRMSVVEVE